MTRLLLGLLFPLALSLSARAADSPVLWDEAGALAPEQKQALIALLVEHRKTTDEKLALAILKDAGAAGIAAKSKDLFDEWRLGEGGRGLGALLVLDSAAHKARWEIGLGLLPKLSDGFAEGVVQEKLAPAWKAGQLYPGLAQTLLETLRAFESPLVDSGRALEVLQAAGPVTYEARWSPAGVFAGWVVLGFSVLGAALAALYVLSAAEAHFTSAGWFKPRPQLSAALDLLRERLSPGARRRRRAIRRFGGTQNDW